MLFILRALIASNWQAGPIFSDNLTQIEEELPGINPHWGHTVFGALGISVVSVSSVDVKDFYCPFTT